MATPGTTIPQHGYANNVAQTRAELDDMAVLLDTTVLMRHNYGEVPSVCAINVEELWRGVRPSEEESLAELMSGLRVVPLGAPEGRMAGQWRRDFAAIGRTLHQADCLIAAAAVSAGLPLATGNPDDFPMTELRVEHWPVNG